MAQEASQAAENAENADTPPEQDWQRQQEQVENEIREQVRQSPEAKSAALENQAEKAEDLAEKKFEGGVDLFSVSERQKSTNKRDAQQGNEGLLSALQFCADKAPSEAIGSRNGDGHAVITLRSKVLYSAITR